MELQPPGLLEYEPSSSRLATVMGHWPQQATAQSHPETKSSRPDIQWPLPKRAFTQIAVAVAHGLCGASKGMLKLSSLAAAALHPKPGLLFPVASIDP
jgi:hypothetical protein